MIPNILLVTYLVQIAGKTLSPSGLVQMAGKTLSPSGLAQMAGKILSPAGSDTAVSNLLQPSFDEVRTNFYFTRLFDCTDPQDIPDWSCKPCKKLPGVTYVTDFKDYLTNTQGYVALNKTSGHIIIVFRATKGIVQQMLDVMLVPIPLLGIDTSFLLVNSGFLIALSTVYSDVLNIIKSLIGTYPDYKLRFVGHSLGGAMSSLALLKMKYDLDLPFERFELYTYGQPRTGNSAFAKFYNKQNLSIARVVNYNDLITQAIPRFMGCVHIGNELFIDPTNTTSPLRYCSNAQLEDPTCSARIDFSKLAHIAHNTYFDQLEYMSCFKKYAKSDI